MQTPQSYAFGILNKHPFENEDGLQNEDDLKIKITSKIGPSPPKVYGPPLRVT